MSEIFTRLVPRSIVVSTRAGNCIFVLIGLIPIALVAWYVVSQGSRAPVGDAWWDPVYFAVKTRTASLTLEDFFVLNSGHRPVFTRLIIAASTILTDYDAGVLRFAALLTTILNLCLIMLLLRGEQSLSGEQCFIALAFSLFSTVLFNLYYPPNWLDMCYSAWQQAMFFVLLGLLILQRMHTGWPAFVLLMLCATAATFSYASGLVAWISFAIAAIGISEYRRLPYAILWTLAMVFVGIFYNSDYAVHPFRTAWDLPSFSKALDKGLIAPILYFVRYQAVRFDMPKIGALLALTCSLALLINCWQLMRLKNGAATVALWGSLAFYTIGTAALVLFARGTFVTQRQSPGADGFWVAFIALSLLVLVRRPPFPLALVNVFLLLAVVIFSVQTDARTLRTLPEQSGSCDKSIVDHPLFRDDNFHKCFIWSENQSVYHLAALRLSVFGDETPKLILQRTDSPVITDMPNKWLSVYVRDYMLAGLPSQNLYSIAPVPGAYAQPPEPYTSPFNRGEWPTDILPQPLQNTWVSPTSLAPVIPSLALYSQLVWYLNTPETESNYLIVERALRELGFTGTKIAIAESRYASARFGLWCFERPGAGLCVSQP